MANNEAQMFDRAEGTNWETAESEAVDRAVMTFNFQLNLCQVDGELGGRGRCVPHYEVASD